MLKLLALTLLVLLLPRGQGAQGQITLGVHLEQGEEGRPVIIKVLPRVGWSKSLGSYLELSPCDQIVTAFSDPIKLPDGNYYEQWDINTISDITWVLQRTRSRIGLKVKRNNEFIQAIATYRVYTEQAVTVCGLEERRTRGWKLEGPSRVEGP